MTPDIERLAKEAGIDVNADTLCRYEGWREPMAKFAALVAEECAKEAEDEDHQVDGHGYYAQLGDSKGTQKNIVAAIRAKFALSSDKPEAK